MKKEFRCPQCGHVIEGRPHLPADRASCTRCEPVQQLSERPSGEAAEPNSYQLSPIAAVLSPALPEQALPRPPAAQHALSPRLSWMRYLRPWVFEASQVQGIGTWLVILSAADLLMTFVLLRRSELFFESNPIAQWFYQQWDITGMVFFKFSMIGGVILLSEIIERKRPGWGRFVLLIGCVGAAFAVFQGGRLYLADRMPLAIEMD